MNNTEQNNTERWVEQQLALQEAKDKAANARTARECEATCYLADRRLEAEKVRARGAIEAALVAGGFGLGGILLKYFLGKLKYEQIKRDEEAGLNTKHMNGLDNQSSIK